MKNVLERIVLSFALLTFFYNSAYAQPRLPKVPGVRLPTSPTVTGIVKDKLIQQLENSRKEFDEASFSYAVSMADNAGTYENEERYQRNQKVLLEALKSSNNTQRSAVENANNYLEVGEMMYASGKYKPAEANFFLAKTVYESEGLTNTTQYARIIANLGLLYHITARYNLAEEFTKKSLEARLTLLGDTSRIYAASVNNLGVLYKEMGRYTESEQQLNKAIVINKNSVGTQSVPYALTLNNLAMLYEEVGRFQEAEKLLKEALAVAGNSMKEKSTNYVRMMINLAQLYFDMNRYADAETIYLNALKIKEQKLGTTHPDYAHILNRLAALYIVMGKHDKVEDLYKKSISVYEKKFGITHPSYAESVYGLGEFYRIKGRNTEALDLLTKAMTIRKTALGEDHPDYIVSIESVGLTYWQLGKQTEATQNLRLSMTKYMKEIHTYFAPMSEVEKGRFWDKIRPAFLRFYSYAVVAGVNDPTLLQDMYNYQLSTKAMLLSSSNKVKKQILSSGDVELIKLYKEWLDMKDELGHYYSMSKTELTEQKINVDSIERATNEREKTLSTRSALFSTGYAEKAVAWDNVKATLLADEAAIEVIQFHNFNKVFSDTVKYAALILTADKATPVLVLLNDGAHLEKRYYNYYRNSIRNKSKDLKSYDQFWSKIDAQLTGKKTLYVSLDGIYNQINLNTLLLPTGKFLIDLKNIITVTNTRDVIELKQTKISTAPGTAVLLGNPTYGTKGKIDALPGTKVEIDGVKAQLVAKANKVTTYTGINATEENIEAIKSPKLLHIATHGFFMPEVDSTAGAKVYGIETTRSRENPLLRSGLLMAGAENAMDGTSENGILFAYEVANMLLDNTELVVMSACETGLGDVKNGEGVYGLQRAFQVAGVKTIIMSLWKVNDSATQLLMNSFYKNYLLTGNKQKAFRAAQLELRAKFPEPYFWGAFVIVE